MNILNFDRARPIDMCNMVIAIGEKLDEMEKVIGWEDSLKYSHMCYTYWKLMDKYSEIIRNMDPEDIINHINFV
jgi:hypothetical protein